MPSYEYPAESMGIEESQEDRRPSVYVPVGPDQAKEVEVGQEVEITLRGKVTGLQAGEDRTSLDLELYSSDVYSADPTEEDQAAAQDREEQRAQAEHVLQDEE